MDTIYTLAIFAFALIIFFLTLVLFGPLLAPLFSDEPDEKLFSARDYAKKNCFNELLYFFIWLCLISFVFIAAEISSSLGLIRDVYDELFNMILGFCLLASVVRFLFWGGSFIKNYSGESFTSYRTEEFDSSHKSEGKKIMNIRRGIERVWTVVSFLYVIFVITGFITSESYERMSWAMLPVLIIGGLIILWGIFFVGVWVCSGFSGENRHNGEKQ